MCLPLQSTAATEEPRGRCRSKSTFSSWLCGGGGSGNSRRLGGQACHPAAGSVPSRPNSPDSAAGGRRWWRRGSLHLPFTAEENIVSLPRGIIAVTAHRQGWDRVLTIGLEGEGGGGTICLFPICLLNPSNAEAIFVKSTRSQNF